MRLKTIYKKTKSNKIQEWTIEVVEDKYRTVSGQVDGIKQTSEWTACQPKNEGKINATTAADQAHKEAEALHKKKLEHGYFKNIKQIDEQQYFEPMSAHKWQDRKEKVSYPLFSQPKLDGIRCVVKHDGMWSRYGKRVISAPHIYESLQPLFGSNPDLIFDGELYCDKLSNNFNKIVSLVKKTKPTEEDLVESRNIIQYHIYDLPSHHDLFEERYLQLSKMPLPCCCIAVRTDTVDDEKQINKYYNDYLEAGYEGQMLRVNAVYENKRSKYLLKHKNFVDAEFEILDVCEGIGNRAGSVGYMVFECGGKRFTSDINCTYEKSVEILENRAKLIGKMATVKYFNLTPDGIPRFPRVINIDRHSYE